MRSIGVRTRLYPERETTMSKQHSGEGRRKRYEGVRSIHAKRRALRFGSSGIERLEDRVTPSAILTWTGAGGNGNWSNLSNWSGNLLPGSGDTLIFPASATYPSNDVLIDDISGGNVSVNSITINSGAPGLTFEASTSVTPTPSISVSSGISDNTSNPVTFDIPTSVASATTPVSISGPTVGGPLDVQSSISGTGSVNFSGNVILTGSNSYTGGTNVINGSLTLNSAAGDSIPSGVLTIANGATVDDTPTPPSPTTPALAQFSTGSSVIDNGTLNIGISETLTALTVNQVTANITSTNVILSLEPVASSSPALVLNGGSINIGSNDNLTLDGNVVVSVPSTSPNTSLISGSNLGGSEVDFGSQVDFTVAANPNPLIPELNLNQLNLGGSNGFSKSGPGLMQISNSVNSTYTGSDMVNDGVLDVLGNLSTTPLVAGQSIQVNTGGTLDGTGTVPEIVLNGGTVVAGVGVPGTLTPGILTSTGGLTSLASLTPPPSGQTPPESYFTDPIDGNQPPVTGANDYGQLNITGGSVNLQYITLNPIFADNYVAAAGDNLDLITNQGGAAIQNSFAGLPSGSFVQSVSHQSFQADYQGGSSGNDFVLNYVNNSKSAVTSSLSPSVYGEAVTLTATVSSNAGGTGVPTGTVTFYDGTTVLGTGPVALTDGTASITIPSFTAGSHLITVDYSGDSNFGPSNSQILTQQVAQSASSTTVVSSISSTVYGQSVTFSGTVVAVSPGAGTPTGNVTFYENGSSIGTSPLNSSGVATFTTSVPLAVGSDTITAKYDGDPNFMGSTSPSIIQTVSQSSTTIMVSSSVPSSVYGQQIVLTASISAVSPGAGIPTGQVTFFNGGLVLGKTILSNGTATLAVKSLQVGSYSITAEYDGDSNFTVSTSSPITQTVDQASTTLVIASTNPSAYIGQQVTLYAAVRPVSPGSGVPTGDVTFSEGSVVLGTAQVVNGLAILPINTLQPGSYAVTASYSGDMNFVASVSKPILQTINQTATTTLLSVPSVVDDGQVFAINAQVLPVSPGAGVPTGTVTFRDGAMILGSATLINGYATGDYSLFGAGMNHDITATYNGDGDYAPNMTTGNLVTVNQAVSETQLSAVLIPFGQKFVQFQIQVSAANPASGMPTGYVFLQRNDRYIRRIFLNDGVAAFNMAFRPALDKTFSVIYRGDSVFQPSVSSGVFIGIPENNGGDPPADPMHNPFMGRNFIPRSGRFSVPHFRDIRNMKK